MADEPYVPKKSGSFVRDPKSGELELVHRTEEPTRDPVTGELITKPLAQSPRPKAEPDPKTGKET